MYQASHFNIGKGTEGGRGVGSGGMGRVHIKEAESFPAFKGAQAWDIRSLGFSWFLENKVFLGRWFGGKNINLILKFLRELRRI
jgi:hypothetical protein